MAEQQTAESSSPGETWDDDRPSYWAIATREERSFEYNSMSTPKQLAGVTTEASATAQGVTNITSKTLTKITSKILQINRHSTPLQQLRHLVRDGGFGPVEAGRWGRAGHWLFDLNSRSTTFGADRPASSHACC